MELVLDTKKIVAVGVVIVLLAAGLIYFAVDDMNKKGDSTP